MWMVYGRGFDSRRLHQYSRTVTGETV